MSSSSRRSNNDHGAPRGSGRSPNSVRRTSSQPPQQFQAPVTVSGTHSGTSGNVPWTNRPPSNTQGTAPGQAPNMYANPSGDNWDYSNLTSQLTGSTQLQHTSSRQLQITVPELYPATSTSSDQYANPQSGDRNRRYQDSTTWFGDTHDLSPSHMSLQPLSPLPQPQTTVPPDVLYSTSPQYPQTPNRGPQNYPPQRRPQQQQQQQQPSPPRPQNNVSSLSQPQVSPNTYQGAPPYVAQYNSLPSSSRYTGTHPSNYGIGNPPVAHQPPPNQNRRDAPIRSTDPGEGGAVLDEWGYRRGGPDTLSASVAPRTAPQTTPQTAPRTAPQTAPRPAPQIVPQIVPQAVRTAPLGVPQPVVNIRQQVRPSQPAATVPRPPICLIPGCRRPVVEDLRTNELTEYCGEAHMIEALQTHGVLVCPACNRFPRRRGRDYCGTSCEQWAAQQRRQQQQQPQQQRQGQRQSSAVNPYPLVPNPNSGSVTWSNAAGGPTSSSSVPSPRVRQGQFHW
ncbi:hypothetical protein H4582DRAFT_2205953 [Lactarius indigo]|nr:hypothetical protein H4582DRAFT_2205953 [Lactarius indigo]